MTVSLEGRVALQELMAQAWQQVEAQARGLLKAAVEGLLQAERDRRVAEAQQRGEKVYRWGYTARKCWTTLWGSLEQVRVPRLRGREEIRLVARYERHGLNQMLFALTVGGLSQRKVVGWVRRFLGGTLSPGSITAGLERAQQQVEQRRSAAIPPRRYRAIVVDGIYPRYRRSATQAARKGRAADRLRTTNLGEGWFKPLRRYLSRFPGCRNAEHSEQVLGCFLLAPESMHR